MTDPSPLDNVRDVALVLILLLIIPLIFAGGYLLKNSLHKNARQNNKNHQNTGGES